MSKQQLLVLISGSGTNLQAIIDATKSNVLNCEIAGVICNNPEAKGLERAQKADIPTSIVPYDKTSQTREEYNKTLLTAIQSQPKFDLVVLAGWMLILPANLIEALAPIPIINLHPAFPNTFVGANAIKQTINSYKKDPENTKAGLMVHQVIPEVDKGKPIAAQQVPIYPTDTEETLSNRIKYYEKPLLLQAITEVLHALQNPVAQESTEKAEPTETPKIHRGKVSDYWDTGYNVLAMYQSQRQSAFDRHICDIPAKGHVLTALSHWWFNQTRHIVPNHMLYSQNQLSLVRKATPIPIEFVVRAFITGSTKTSLWTNYNDYYTNPETDPTSSFKFCGSEFPPNLKKNQPLDKLYITPTTKGKTEDKPITPQDAIDTKLVTTEEWNYIANKCLQLFTFGQQVSNERGYILVDTKYEFGRDAQTGEILLIDELHTCDSSRYWRKDTYQTLTSTGKEPEKLDKDMIRDYITANTEDPYDTSKPLPTPPPELIRRVNQTYINFANEFLPTPLPKTFPTTPSPQEITNTYFASHHRQLIIVLADPDTINEENSKNLTSLLTKHNLPSTTITISPHKQTKQLLNLLTKLNEQSHRQLIMLTTSHTLSTITASNTTHPVYVLQQVLSSPLPPSTPLSVIADVESFAQQVTKYFRW